MERIKSCSTWGVILALWTAGALLLWKAWLYQKALPDPLGSYIEFTIMFVGTFYVFALYPIKLCVERFLCRCGQIYSSVLVRS